MPRCPLPNDEYIEYDGQRVSEDMTVEPRSADWVHRVEARDAFIDQLIDACTVEDANAAWSEYQRMCFRVTGIDGDPTEDDVTRFGVGVSDFHGCVPDAVSEDWPSSVVAEQTIANIAKAFTCVGKEAAVKAALKVGSASKGEGEPDTWEAVLQRMGGLVATIDAGAEASKLFRREQHRGRHRSRSPPRRRTPPSPEEQEPHTAKKEEPTPTCAV